MEKNNYITRIRLRWKAIVSDFNKKSSEERKKVWFAIAIYLALDLFISAMLSGYFIRLFAHFYDLNASLKGYFYYAFANPIGRLLTFIFFIAILLVPIAYIFKRNLANTGIRYDPERKIWISQSGEKGTADFMSYERAQEVYKISDILDTNEIVYGQVGNDATRTVSYKPKTVGGSGNKNLLLIGSPGTGKSFCFVRTNIVQAMLRGDSIIATDPSGELYQDLGSLLRKNDYNVQVLNLAEPRYSDFWDCMTEVIDPETGRLDGTRLNDFTDIYVKNSGSSGDGGGKFWADCSTNLLRAVIGYSSWQREIEIINQYIALYKKVSKDLPDMNERDRNLGKMDPNDRLCPFTWCEKIILETAKKTGFDEEEIKKTIEEIKENAPDFTIREVYNNLMSFREIEGEISDIPFYHPAKQAHIIYSDASDTVKASAINGTRLSMQIFSDEKLMAALSHKGIEIANINMKKCAYFVIMSDKSKATTPIASLFFSFFFKDAQDNWDKWQKISDEKGIKNPCKDTFVMLDEFFSIGVIGGDPTSFATTMSVNRKRHLAINIAIQSISQLPALYGPDNAEAIQTCCDYLLFLGCNDVKTAQLISTFFAGKTTVVSERHTESSNVIGTLGDDANVNVSSSGRGVLEIDEVRRWKDKVFLVLRGENPFDIQTFPWTSHPCFVNGETKKESIYSTMIPIEKRAEELDAIAEKKKNYKETMNTTKSVQSKFSSSKKKPSKKPTTQKSVQASLGIDKAKNDLKIAQEKTRAERVKKSQQTSLF